MKLLYILKKSKASLILLIFLLALTLNSCVSETSLDLQNGRNMLVSKTTFNDTYFALERDYNSEMSGKTNKEILDELIRDISLTLEKYNILFDIKNSDNTIDLSFTSTKEELEEISRSITNDESNPILFYENENLRININCDNYMDLKVFIPLLENETVYSYTAAFNSDTSKEEYLEIIGYVLSEDIASSLEKCHISFTISDGKNTMAISFTLLDFLLLHSPIFL